MEEILKGEARNRGPWQQPEPKQKIAAREILHKSGQTVDSGFQLETDSCFVKNSILSMPQKKAVRIYSLG